jgi:hypothetical protein
MRAISPLLKKRKDTVAREFAEAMKTAFNQFQPEALVGIATLTANPQPPTITWGIGFCPPWPKVEPTGRTDIWGGVKDVAARIRKIAPHVPARIVLLTDGEDERFRQLTVCQDLQAKKIVVDTVFFSGSETPSTVNGIAAISFATLGIFLFPMKENVEELRKLVSGEAFIDLTLRDLPPSQDWIFDRDAFGLADRTSTFDRMEDLPPALVSEKLKLFESTPTGYVSQYRERRIGKELKICQILGQKVAPCEANSGEWKVVIEARDKFWWGLSVLFPWNYPYRRPVFRVEAYKCASLSLGRVPDDWLGEFKINERVYVLLKRIGRRLPAVENIQNIENIEKKSKQWRGEGDALPVKSSLKWEMCRGKLAPPVLTYAERERKADLQTKLRQFLRT